MSREEPIFNVPGSVLAVLALLVAVHVLLAALPEDSGTWLQMALAFIPARYSGYAEALPGGGLTASHRSSPTP